MSKDLEVFHFYHDMPTKPTVYSVEEFFQLVRELAK
jgi:hypothetical protein